MQALLREVGLTSRCERFELPLTRAGYRDWLKLPPVSCGFLPETDPARRAQRLERLFAPLDPAARRIESWLVWTAWPCSR
jgi:hypothetical protein